MVEGSRFVINYVDVAPGRHDQTIAAPMIGGVVSSFLLELMVYPAIYEVWRGWQLRRAVSDKPSAVG
jgi:hypothetical protein